MFLTLEKLTIFNQNSILVNLLDNLSNTITITDSLALVGQSGSGKSLTLKTIMGMLPNNLDVEFQYKSDFQLSLNNIGFIPQNPFTSLSPMTKIKQQFFQKDDVIDYFLNVVGLSSDIKNKFPSQLSGGQLQRVIIAIVLATKPKLLLLDEPTTALDTASKTIILDLIQELQNKFNFLMIFISHDIESVKTICKKTAVLYNGAVVEYNTTKTILQLPSCEYTKTLLSSGFGNREFRK